MQTVERIPQIAVIRELRWQDYLVDTILAIVGALLLTGIIYFSKLYPTIPDISVVYLLLILALALMRGIYASVLSALVAFLAFDFFLVPPLYSFTIAQAREWIALFVFLIVALITSLLAARMRQRTEEARQRELEARILYELMRVTNDAEDLEDQLDIVALSLIRVFAAWGVRACALLLPDAAGTLHVRADAPIRIDDFTLTPAERLSAAEVMAKGETIVQCATTERGLAQYLIPLRSRKQVLGVLYLRIRDGAAWFARIDGQTEARDLASMSPGFFWTFLDQATALVERALLREQAITHNS